HSRHARGCGARRTYGGPAARTRRVRHRLFLPGGSQGPGPHPHPDVGGACARAARQGPGCLCGSRPGARRPVKALVKKEARPGIWMEDIPEPKPGPNDVLIRITKTAICGTDMHIYNWDDWAQKTIPVPMAVGHEYCGRIVEVGAEVRGLQVGDR